MMIKKSQFIKVNRKINLFKGWLLSLLLFTSSLVLAQDPPQYGTPFSGVPDPRDVSMYQVNIRSFSVAGNLDGVTARLDNIKALGINVIYLMPVYPTGEDPRSKFASSASPYCIKDFTSVSSEYGTLQSLRTLVDAAHSKGMAVILDWVVNQTSWDHPWITQHPDWYVRDANGVIQQLGSYSDVAALNFNNQNMRTSMINAMRSWVFTANIDGFRCDFANNPPLDFWTQANSSLRSINTHKLLLFAEGDRPQHFQSGFDYNFGFDWYYNVLKSIAAGGSLTNIDNSTNKEYTYANSTQQVVRYTANHDTETEATAIEIFGSTQGVMANFLICAYMRGVPFLHGGQEVAFNVRNPFPYDQVTIDWTPNPAVTDEFAKVIKFRNSSNAIRRGTVTNYSNTNVCAFTKVYDTEKVIVLTNLRNYATSYTIPAAMAGTYQDAFTGATVNLVAGTTVSLGNFAYRVYTNVNQQIAVTGVTVSPTSQTLAVGSTFALSASVLPAIATNKNVTWTSGNTSIATVDGSGMVKAVQVGTVTITATTEDGNYKATSTITVTPGNSFSVYFYKPSDWGTTINIYYWGVQPAGAITSVNWPGVAMTNMGNGWYKYTFNNITSTNLIFNDGTNQTADLSRNTTGWYKNNSWYNSEPTLTISNSNLSFDNKENSSLVQVTSNVNWTASSSQSWIAVTPATGNNNASITLTVATNTSTSSRTGTVTITGAGFTRTVTVSQDGLPAQSPFGGTARSIPGTIQAEDYDNGGQGIAYYDNDISNNGGQYRVTEGVDIEVCSEGGYNIGWTDAGEWMEYSVNVTATGTYTISARVASITATGSFRVEFDGIDKTGTVMIPNTAGWQNWQTVTINGVNLTAGPQIVRIYTLSAGFNLNQISIVPEFTYYRFRNRWQGTYLYADASITRYASLPESDQRSQWQQELVDGYIAFKNRATGQYMNIQSQLAYVECTAVPSTYWSAQWTLESYNGYVRIRNRWMATEYIHIENLPGYAQHSAISSDAYSSHWTVEKVGASLAQRLASNSISTNDTDEDILVYPNPASGNFTIQLDHPLLHLDLVNQMGDMVVPIEITNGTDKVFISAESLDAGVYFLKGLRTDGTLLVKKVVIVE